MAEVGHWGRVALVTAAALIWAACTDQTLDLLSGGGAGAPAAAGASGGAPPSDGGPDDAYASADAYASSDAWEPGTACFGGEQCEWDEYCDPFSRDCERLCETSYDCPGYRPICDVTFGHCVECTEDEHCSREAPERPICVFFTGQCEECIVDEHCSEPEPFCHPADFRCRECVVSEQCAADEVCDTDRYDCVRPG